MEMKLVSLTVLAAFASVTVLAFETAAVDPPASQQQAKAQADALKDFQKRLDDYLDLRSDLAEKLGPLRPTADSAELTARQEALAAAIRAARKNARRGDLIPEPVASQIRAAVVADLKNRNREARQATVAEVPTGIALVINRQYPANAALPTVPPLLLSRLPPLPDNLQYRFANRDLVLLDGDTQIIVDYVVNVLPPH
jgi:hypothetical protein